MGEGSPPTTETAALVMGPDGLDALVAALAADGYRVLGPQERDGAIVYDDLAAGTDLPAGLGEVQDAATYRVVPRDDEARFGYPVGPHSWKRFLLPAQVRVWQATRDEEGAVTVIEEPPPERPLAFIGVRSCDLHAIAIQDRVFLEGAHVDRDYAARRTGAFIVVVQCGVPGGTCFCTSMDTGPRAGAGFDLALTEVLDGDLRYVVQVGSERGARIAESLGGRAATDTDDEDAAAVTAGARAGMGRHVDADGLPNLLATNLDHPRWEEVAERCLTCGNCTMACPTCFCTSVDDVNLLEGDIAERHRHWDSCFSVEYSHIHGGAVRPTGRSRYRQWLTHKFGTWVEQFGTSGCVGCGRCVTWCPVGIDVTEELTAIRLTDGEVSDAHA